MERMTFLVLAAVLGLSLIVAPTITIVHAQLSQTEELQPQPQPSQPSQQNQTNQTNQNQTVKTIAGLNASNIDKAIETQGKLINIAKLHNAATSGLSSINRLLDCVSDIVKPLAPNPIFNSSQALPSCDNNVTDMIVNHELGNNQSMIKTAYAYLKSRGIQ